MKQHSADLRRAFAANPARFHPPAPPRLIALQQPSAMAAPRRPAPAQRSGEASLSPASERLRQLGLHGMARALGEARDPASVAWLGPLIEAEIADRKERRVAARLRAARLRYAASPAEVDYSAVRGFDDGLFHWLLTGQWIADRQNLIIDGPTGVGKTWLACALGQAACDDERTVRYERLPQLLSDLDAMRGTPRHARRLRLLGTVELLILDDWGLEALGANDRRDLLDIADRRYGSGSTLIVSQVAVEEWAPVVGDPGVAAVFLDRVAHHAHRMQLRGASLRGRQPARLPVMPKPGAHLHSLAAT